MTSGVAGVGATELVVMLLVAGIPIVELLGLVVLVARMAGRQT